MEIEAHPLLHEDDKKAGSLDAQRSKKDSRLRSWAVAIMTHGLVALLVLLAVIITPTAGFVSYHDLWNAKVRSKLYCTFAGWPFRLNFHSSILSTSRTCHQVYD